MNLDVEIIRDKNNDAHPQYRDSEEKEGGEDATLKPLTKDVVQEVILKNLPETQKVEVTNQKEVQDVNVTNQKTSVDVNNFPETQDVSVQGQEAEFETIMNNEVIEAGESTGRIDINTKGCKRIIKEVNTDVTLS